MKHIQDRPAPAHNGFIVLLLLIVISAIAWLIFPLFLFPLALLFFILASGFTIIQPNEAKVLTLFGTYVGTLKENGFLFTLPLTLKKSIPLKLINFVTDRLKVNDLNGNPIEIAAVVVWRVQDAAQASFNVHNYVDFVANQSDIAIRSLAAHYPYDSEKETSLRGNIDAIAAQLKESLQERLALVGIIIEETKLSHLAYAPEIAAAMLKRQQAVAIFQARQYMVQNALAIIDEVMNHFDQKSDIQISDEKKAELINSLLIVMTSDKESTPVLNVVK